MPRTIIPLNEGWTFSLDGANFTLVSIPHDWCIERPVDENAPLNMSQGYFHRGDIGWYLCPVTIEKREQHRYFLDFGGVFEQATVLLNGVEVGRNSYGPSPFRLDVTDAIRSGENTLLVKVDCTAEPADRWYSGCGIYRPVKLIVTEDVHLDESRIAVTQQVAEDCAALNIQTGTDMPVLAKLTGPDGVTLTAQGTSRIRLTILAPRLWSAETPHLYTLTLSLLDRSRVADEISLRIGLRDVQFVPNEGLFVNGEHVYLRGVCLHQDMGCRGIAAKKEMWRERLNQLKQMGCNAIRASHHVHAEEFMDLCDEMGFYVYEECFDKWHSGAYARYFADNWQSDVNAMLLRDRNRPSVIIWGIGNEVENQAHDSMIGTLKMLIDHAHAVDPTRPVTYAMNPHFKRPANIDLSKVKDIQAFVDEVDDREIDDLTEKLACIRRICEHVDIISCNYQEQWYPQIHAMMPDKLILGTEIYQYFVGDPEHYQNYTENPPPLIAESKKWLLGGFIWSGFDYLGESMGWPSKGWTGAVIRTNGNPRASYHMLRSFWKKEPMIHLAILDYTMGDEFVKEHWGFPPYEAHWDFPMVHKQLLPYMIATNCERVVIEVPGRSFAAPAKGANGLITGFLPYLPGFVTAKGYTGDRLVCEHWLVTPGPAARLTFDAHADLPAEKGYEVMLTVRVQDEEGNSILRANRPVSFAVEGPAVIVAVDNGDLMETTPYSSHTLPLWHGQASVVIRLTGEAGDIRISACADGITPAALILNAM